MSKQKLAAAPVSVPPEKLRELQALTQPAFIAWPTAIVWAIGMLGILSTHYLALTGQIPLWGACLALIAFMYLFFGVVHDATHRAISSVDSVNSFIGYTALFPVTPYVSLGLFRWAHMQHHRFTNGTKDPDQWVHGAWWTLPIRWATFDIYYVYFVLRGDCKIGKRQLRGTLVRMALTIVAATLLARAGYGLELLALWLIPARITMAIFGFVFFWLPHVKEDVSSQENLTLASGIRLGHEWLLNIVLQFHNYHLIHHLYPSTPPYNHPKIWKLLRPELMKRDLAIQYGFALQPSIHYGLQATKG